MNPFDNHMVCEFDPAPPAAPEVDPCEAYKDQRDRGFFDLAVTNARDQFAPFNAAEVLARASQRASRDGDLADAEALIHLAGRERGRAA